ncbi:MAG: VWA domain-containing protein [Sandarakinorhabdus sp.]|nr:VWA domain-containing protein [Sandarakinorhabdus sp.]
MGDERPGDDTGASSDERWALALRVVALLAANPARIGGVLLRARPGPVRDLWADALGRAVRVRRLPASADGEALDGGLDLTATLAAGRPVLRAGVLAEIAGGVLIVPMAERLAPALAARLCSAVDEGGPLLVLFDESAPDGEERVSAGLEDRLAIHLDLNGVRLPMAALLSGTALPEPLVIAGDPTPVDDAVTALATAAVQLGIASIRAPIHAGRIAYALAMLDHRKTIANPDLATAAALVLGPRARQIPQNSTAEAPETPPEPPAEMPPSPPESTGDADADTPQPPSNLNDMVLEAAGTSLPPGLLDALANGIAFKSPATGNSGARLRTLTSGRPAGIRAGSPGRGARLALIDTIKAAAPWQKLREIRADGRLSVTQGDLRIRRFVSRAQSTTVFAVDASGSAAFARMSEAKGAVELLLAQAYVKRAEVALIAFRGEGATVCLPPTRSLARAKKELAALAGGGGTPMAAGIDLARRTAEAERSRGRTPLVVVLTDGRANVGGGEKTPQEAALASARSLGATGIATVFIDCSTRARPEGAALAQAMGARFVALPRLDARAVVAAVNLR